MVPVLSSSSVVTSPAASTARLDIASTLRCTSRSMPAMPMADSRAPIVVGIRQTSRATSTEDAGGAPEYDGDGLQAWSTTTKEHDREARPAGSYSAISFGVFCRAAPSTRRDHPVDEGLAGLEVMRTTIRSRSTRVPPVTARAVATVTRG